MCAHALGWVSRGAKIKRVKSRKGVGGVELLDPAF